MLPVCRISFNKRIACGKWLALSIISTLEAITAELYGQVLMPGFYLFAPE